MSGNNTELSREQLITNALKSRAKEYSKLSEEQRFAGSFEETAESVHATAREKGWWDEPREYGTVIALMHSELSEALEALRHGNPPSVHIPEFSGVEEEFADVIIRIMDLAAAEDWKIGEAVIAKMGFNKSRPYKHGKKF